MRIARNLFLGAALIALPTFAHAAPIAVGDIVTLTDGPGTTGGGEFERLTGSARLTNTLMA